MEHIDKQSSSYDDAVARVAEIKKFYSKIIKYVVFILFFTVLSYWNNNEVSNWVLWVAFLWGIMLVFKAFKVFYFNPFFGKKWEERKIKKIMDQE